MSVRKECEERKREREIGRLATHVAHARSRVASPRGPYMPRCVRQMRARTNVYTWKTVKLYIGAYNTPHIYGIHASPAL